MAHSICTSKDTPWLKKKVPHLSLGNDVPPTTASEQSLSWLRQQVQNCTSTHASCSAASLLSLPSRLIDVGTGSGPGAVRLCEPKEERAPNVCMSHCWGRKPFLRTLFTNINSHRREIPWEELPLTFQETVILTRRLGLRYVWIDSLCIIQDDQDDWRREAANLAAIFQNSYLVITAARSAGPDEGLFASLSEGFKTYTIEAVGDDGAAEHIYCRQSFQHIQSQTGRLLGTPPALPTLKRGWIFQERFLSPRVVHFGPEEMSWECLEDMTCQCAGQRDISESYAAAGAPRWLRQMLERTSRPKSYYNLATWQTLQEAELENCWHRLVEDYTRLDLTFEKDIFPAISGLAKQFQRIKGSQYLAGLWQDSLRKDLLWRVEPKHSEDSASDSAWAQRPQNWRAPSWSWASVKSAVQFIDPTEGMDYSCEVIDASCSLACPDPTGEVTAGHVTLRGRLIPTTVRYNDKVSHEELKPRNLLRLGLLQGRMGNAWADWDYWLMTGPQHVRPEWTVWCFIVSQTLPTSAFCCLILKAAGDDQKMSHNGIFERIGLLELFAGRASSEGVSWKQQVLDLGEMATVKII